MRFLFSLLLIISGLAGVVVSFVSDISVTSSLYVLNGKDLSIVLGVFSVVLLLNGIYNLFTNN